MNEDNTCAYSVMRMKVIIILDWESTGRGSKSTAREKAKRHNPTHDNFSISCRSFIFLFLLRQGICIYGRDGVWFPCLVWTLSFFMNRFSLLESLLSPEQVSALRAVQSGLERDPTCLDRASTETVPNCYTEEATPPTKTEETTNA